MKYILFVILLICVLITAGCTSETKNSVSIPTPAPILTVNQPIIVSATLEKTTTINTCDVSGSCTDLARRMKESLSDCQIYGEKDPKCHNSCNVVWINRINQICPT